MWEYEYNTLYYFYQSYFVFLLRLESDPKFINS